MIETLKDIGEQELLNRLKQFMPIGQIDDDTAKIKTCSKQFLINTDLLVDEVHFSDLTTSPEDIGWKAIASNVSDLTSSGSTNMIAFTVGLVAPSNTSWNWVKGVYIGITAALKYFGGKLVGGDCSKGKQKMLAITAIGSVSAINLHRSNAQPGDHLVTSGPHGLSRLGLGLLLSDPLTKSLPLTDSLKQRAINAH